MNPANGRFTQQDSFAGFDSDPVSLHKYLYANNGPVTFTDPSGNQTMAGTMTGVNVAGNLMRLTTPLIRHAVASCVGMAVASMIPGLEGVILPGPLGLCESNTMRVQFQVSPVSGGVTLYTHAQAIYGLPGIGVSATQVEAVMRGLFQLLPPWWPHSLESVTVGMMARTSIAIRRRVPGGVFGNVYVWKEPYVNNRLEYRIDVENKRGHNLKRF